MSLPLDDAARRRLLALGAGLPDPGARWRILREVGRGGMGVVYEAEDLHLHRRVALKMLEGSSPALRERFAREAAAAARLRHPHIAAIFDATPDAIAMQFIDGQPLHRQPRQGPRRTVALVRDAARAVHHAHEHGLVHRDLKPGNLLVEGDTVYVVDFGLAKDVRTEASSPSTGGLLGTPDFMAPEQANGQAADARTDVHGLGATLFAALTGRPPFVAPDLPTLLTAIVQTQPPRTGIDPDLDLVLGRALAKEQEHRYPTAGALADDLDRWLQGLPVQARPPSTGYRLRKFLTRRRAVVAAVLLTGLLAVLATGAILVPAILRQRAVTDALDLSWRCAGILAEADLDHRAGRRKQVTQRLDAGIAEVRTFVASNDVARAWALLGRLLRVRGLPDEAVPAFERALQLDPTLRGARFERGLCLVDSDPERATTDLATEIGPDDNLTVTELLFGRAERHRLRGELETARKLLHEAVARDSLHWPSCIALSRVYGALGEDQQAMRWSVQGVDLLRGFAPAYRARGEDPAPAEPGELEIDGVPGVLIDVERLPLQSRDAVAMAIHGTEELRAAARAAAAQDVAGAVAAVHRALRHVGGALQALPETDERERAVLHNNRAVAALLLASLHWQRGDAATADATLAHARGDLDLASHQDDSLHVALRNRALLHALVVEHLPPTDPGARAAALEATAATEQALTLVGEHVPTLLLHARTHELLATVDSTRVDAAVAALTAYDRAHTAAPADLRVRFLRGSLHRRLGNRDAALRDLRAARLAAPADWPWLLDCTRELQAAETPP
ncbi:MAG: protein kinase [Planctomycetes bacterium]|nr:protein kinase [Planctomycetota bacterium]